LAPQKREAFFGQGAVLLHIHKNEGAKFWGPLCGVKRKIVKIGDFSKMGGKFIKQDIEYDFRYAAAIFLHSKGPNLWLFLFIFNMWDQK
tara:strand:- start:134 stop:400 length:267 start_codon:yes stop_codon:yes gene_type:complete